MIGVDVLTKQGHLAHAGRGQTLGLGDDLGDRPRDLLATGVGHDTEGTELVAAFLHGEKGGHAARLNPSRCGGRKFLELFLGIEFGLDDLAASLHLFNQTVEGVITLWTHHHIDHRRAADDFGAFGLSDAAGNGDQRFLAGAGALFLEAANPSQFGIDLLGGLFANVAGVEEDQIGLLHVWRFLIAGRRQRVCHPLGIIDVHLAAIGFDENFFGLFQFIHMCSLRPPRPVGSKRQVETWPVRGNRSFDWFTLFYRN